MANTPTLYVRGKAEVLFTDVDPKYQVELSQIPMAKDKVYVYFCHGESEVWDFSDAQPFIVLYGFRAKSCEIYYKCEDDENEILVPTQEVGSDTYPNCSIFRAARVFEKLPQPGYASPRFKFWVVLDTEGCEIPKIEHHILVGMYMKILGQMGDPTRNIRYIDDKTVFLTKIEDVEHRANASPSSAWTEVRKVYYRGASTDEYTLVFDKDQQPEESNKVVAMSKNTSLSNIEAPTVKSISYLTSLIINTETKLVVYPNGKTKYNVYDKITGVKTEGNISDNNTLYVSYGAYASDALIILGEYGATNTGIIMLKYNSDMSLIIRTAIQLKGGNDTYSNFNVAKTIVHRSNGDYIVGAFYSRSGDYIIASISCSIGQTNTLMQGTGFTVTVSTGESYTFNTSNVMIFPIDGGGCVIYMSGSYDSGDAIRSLGVISVFNESDTLLKRTLVEDDQINKYRWFMYAQRIIRYGDLNDTLYLSVIPTPRDQYNLSNLVYASYIRYDPEQMSTYIDNIRATLRTSTQDYFNKIAMFWHRDDVFPYQYVTGTGNYLFHIRGWYADGEYDPTEEESGQGWTKRRTIEAFATVVIISVSTKETIGYYGMYANGTSYMIRSTYQTPVVTITEYKDADDYPDSPISNTEMFNVGDLMGPYNNAEADEANFLYQPAIKTLLTQLGIYPFKTNRPIVYWSANMDEERPGTNTPESTSLVGVKLSLSPWGEGYGLQGIGVVKQ